MKKMCMVVLMSLVMGLVMGSMAGAFEGMAYFKSVNDIEERVAVNNNGVKINNVSLSEESSWGSKELNKISLSFSAVNRTEATKHFSLMIVGEYYPPKDSEETSYVGFAIKAEPMMGILSAGKTENVTASVYVPPGTLKKMNWFSVVIYGDF